MTQKDLEKISDNDLAIILEDIGDAYDENQEMQTILNEAARRLYHKPTKAYSNDEQFNV